MQSLASTLACFEPPMLTAERKAEIDEWNRRERQRKVLERIDRAHIPGTYRRARLSECDPKVAEWFGELMVAEATNRQRQLMAHEGMDVPDTVPLPGLILRGDVGRGKTYSACAALLAHCREYPEVPVRFATMNEILADVKATFDGWERQADVVARYSNVRVLVVDDFGKEQVTEWALPTIFRIIDNRYREGRCTVFTTQYRDIELGKHLKVKGDPETAKAILSRMSSCRVVLLTGADRRFRCA